MIKNGILISIFTLVLISTSLAQIVLNEPIKLIAADGATDDRFGVAAAISGDWAIVGAEDDEDHGFDSGAAYIFRYQDPNWVQQAKLTPADVDEHDNFGKSVALSGDVAIVGADGSGLSSSRSGSAYIFRYNGANWVQEDKIFAQDGALNDHFGCSVSISGDWAIAGAYSKDFFGDQSGAAYIFRCYGNNWIQYTKLKPSDAGAGDNFGVSVDISSDGTAIIGAYRDDDGGEDSGSAYIFKHQNGQWIQKTKITPSDPNTDKVFGSSVALSGSYALIGAVGDNDKGEAAGAAYIFHQHDPNWVQQAKLIGSDTDLHDRFGGAVALDGDSAIVGAIWVYSRGYSRGAAYIFRRIGADWVEQNKLMGAVYPGDDGRFGTSVSIDGRQAITGASWADGLNPDCGAAYIFDIPCPFSLPGDLNDDCRNDLSDLALMTSRWLTDCRMWPSDPACAIKKQINKNEQFKLLPSDPATDNHFGWAVDLDQNVAIVGAPQDDHAGGGSGSAYIFRYDGVNWSPPVKLIATDAGGSDRFGCAVALSGATAIVGACSDDNDGGISAGAAYVFRFDGAHWIQQAKLTAADGAHDDNFGSAVALSGNIAIVGQNPNIEGDAGIGSAYIFKYDGSQWIQQAKLNDPQATLGEHFGWAVAIEGNTALVGSIGNKQTDEFFGSVHIFSCHDPNWVAEAKWTHAEDDWRYFGCSVSLCGDKALVGAYGEYVHTGAAFVFQYNGADWVQQAHLMATDTFYYDRFGSSVAISDDFALIGTPQDCDDYNRNGSAYLFHYDGANWIKKARITASDAGTYDYFGCAVALDGNMALVGAYGNDDQGDNPGAAYQFNLPCQFFRGDLNNDCRVDFYDYALQSAHWLIDCKANPNDPACIARWK